jgi:hypothetical protein
VAAAVDATVVVPVALLAEVVSPSFVASTKTGSL